MKTKKPIESIVVFGDSTTFGFVDTSGKGGWVGRLKKWFEAHDYEGNRLYNLSVDGGTTRDLFRRIEVEVKYREPGLIILAIGLNDASRHPRKNSPTKISIEEFSRNLAQIIKISKKFAKKVIFVSPEPSNSQRTMPVPWGFYYDLEDEKRYYAVMKKICKKEKIYFIDIFSGWLASGNRYKKLLYDGLHPNAKGHEAIFKSVLRFLRRKKIL